jgi:hypothetical protein
MNSLILAMLLSADPILTKVSARSCRVAEDRIICTQVMDFRSSDKKDFNRYTGIRTCNISKKDDCYIKMIDWKW